MPYTVELPGIVGVEIEIGNDVGVARQQSGLAMEEMDDELFVGRVESKAGREVEVVAVMRSSHGYERYGDGMKKGGKE